MSLLKIQSELKAPKGQFNSFGKYKYRNCEDILEAVKPLLLKYECTMTITDEITEIAGRVYVKASATLKDGDNIHTVSAFAREDENKKGMDLSQLTGATSSYARKYALNGLFLIDDTKDADATNDHGNKEVAKKPATTEAKTVLLSKGDANWEKCVVYLSQSGANPDALKVKYRFAPETEKQLLIDAAELQLKNESV